MKLNDQIAGLPEWPPITFDEQKKEYAVTATHGTLGRYIAAQWLVYAACYAAFGLIVYGFFGGDLAKETRPKVVGAGIVAFFTMTALPTPRILCEKLFPRKTTVRFQADAIIANGESHDLTQNVAVQFCANRTALSEDRFRKLARRNDAEQLSGYTAGQLKFYKIEMVYGSRIIRLTSVADAERASQFAIGLQDAYDLARKNLASQSTVSRAAYVFTEDEDEREEAIPE